MRAPFDADPFEVRSKSSCCKGTREDMWQSTVVNLMRYVPVVIVDVRSPSDIVRDEFDWLHERRLHGKAWYLAAGEEGVSPEEVEAVCQRYPLIGAFGQSRIVTQTMLASAVWSRSGIQFPEATPTPRA